MQIIKLIRNKLLLREIRNHSNFQPRNIQVFDFSTAKTIGVIYEIQEEDDHQIVTSFIKELQEDQKTIRAVGFVPGEVVPHYCIPKLSYDFYTRKNQNFFAKPNLPFVQDFLNEKFDMLIDLSLHDIPSVFYLASLAQASFKVGRHKNQYDPYDVMLQISENTPLTDFIPLLRHYINLLKNS